MRKSFLFSIAMLMASTIFGDEGQHSYVPPVGFVPDAETAISIAEAVWYPIYGKETIDRELPITATLKEGVWFVLGTLPKGYSGGVAIAEISKKDGRILRVSHGK